MISTIIIFTEQPTAWLLLSIGTTGLPHVYLRDQTLRFYQRIYQHIYLKNEAGTIYNVIPKLSSDKVLIRDKRRKSRPGLLRLVDEAGHSINHCSVSVICLSNIYVFVCVILCVCVHIFYINIYTCKYVCICAYECIYTSREPLLKVQFQVNFKLDT